MSKSNDHRMMACAMVETIRDEFDLAGAVVIVGEGPGGCARPAVSLGGNVTDAAVCARAILCLGVQGDRPACCPVCGDSYDRMVRALAAIDADGAC